MFKKSTLGCKNGYFADLGIHARAFFIIKELLNYE